MPLDFYSCVVLNSRCVGLVMCNAPPSSSHVHVYHAHISLSLSLSRAFPVSLALSLSHFLSLFPYVTPFLSLHVSLSFSSLYPPPSPSTEVLSRWMARYDNSLQDAMETRHEPCMCFFFPFLFLFFVSLQSINDGGIFSYFSFNTDIYAPVLFTRLYYYQLIKLFRLNLFHRPISLFLFTVGYFLWSVESQGYSNNKRWHKTEMAIQ